jgi:AcrR family transcriptional regulator
MAAARSTLHEGQRWRVTLPHGRPRGRAALHSVIEPKQEAGQAAGIIVQISTYMPRGRYQKSDISRERILEAATEVFSTRGYAGAGVDRLAERSGIAKTAIYYHFGNKEGLLAAVLERAATQWIEGIHAAASQGGDPLQRLDRALAGMRAMLEERPWIYKLFQILALEVADEKPEIRATLRAILDKARDAIVAGIRDALGVELPGAGQVASMMLSLLDGISLGLQIDDSISLDEVFAELRRVIAFMVATRLNPQLAQLFDHPPGTLQLMLAAVAAHGGKDDERSSQSDG